MSRVKPEVQVTGVTPLAYADEPASSPMVIKSVAIELLNSLSFSSVYFNKRIFSCPPLKSNYIFC
ncbi:MAG: hypothetical protein HKO81_03920 [Flavobacteriaceae bacterium]|nr:hypothetical protein [Flavobacteriaceae bacterium]